MEAMAARKAKDPALKNAGFSENVCLPYVFFVHKDGVRSAIWCMFFDYMLAPHTAEAPGKVDSENIAVLSTAQSRNLRCLYFLLVWDRTGPHQTERHVHIFHRFKSQKSTIT
jgi:hypothetical protein